MGMTFRERAIEIMKIAGKEMMERADELIPAAKYVKELNVWIRIPSLSDDPQDVPEIEVSVNVYPTMKTLSQMRKIRNTEE